MRLSELKTGEKALIVKVLGRGGFRKRIIEMGFIKGKSVEVILNAPLKDPIEYKVMDYHISLRRQDAALIEVINLSDINATNSYLSATETAHTDEHSLTQTPSDDELREIAFREGKTINVALIGNPNCGKTSLFNFASGSHEHVGNYSGVTVDAKQATFKQNGYTFKIVDLPGTYSLSAYTPEEIYVRNYLATEQPDVVINVVDSSNLERNLYLTSQLLDMDVQMVIALNMYDELEKRGSQFDHTSLAEMIGTPIVPTVSKTGRGIEALFNQIIKVYEHEEPIVRHIHINYGEALEQAISKLKPILRKNKSLGKNLSKRYLAIKLLEKDREIEQFVSTFPNAKEIFTSRNQIVDKIEHLLNEDSETAFTDARYGFISGALRETFQENQIEKVSNTQIIDTFVTHKLLGFPIFILFMWLMFETTFKLGAYPVEWIEWAVDSFGELIRTHMQEGPVKDLLVNGIIGGVGGVIVFLPNILILYLFISFMEDSGYMARAAFIMDKIMHKMGLHGKSFIPLVMGFGCNVPAIMASRTIESRNSRMITMLVNPLMSCSARLPVYVLLTSAFFPRHASLVMLSLYATGVLLAVLAAKVFKKYLFAREEVPFVMELPPYRMPTMRSILHHMWEKARQYLQKMGGVILLASLIIWFMGYYPQHNEYTDKIDQRIELLEQEKQSSLNAEAITASIDSLDVEKSILQQKHSYIGKVGQFIEPVLRPLGFDWKISVSLLSGMAAKEVVVSTLSVLYTGHTDETTSLQHRLQTEKQDDGLPAFTQLTALCLMLFVLIYFPCIATVSAIKHESGSWKWGAFVMTYTTVLAWVVAFVVKTVGTLILSFF